MARINFKTIAKNVDYTTFATYQEMLSYAGGSLSYPGQILGVLQAHDTPDNVTPFILDANKTPVGIASFTKVQEMIEDQIGNMAGALVLQDNAPSDEFNDALTNHTAGWTFVVTTAGTYVGQTCNIGDMIVCKTTGTSANNADWFVVESNQPNMVTSDISSPLNQEVPVFGATGKTIGGSGISMGQVATILENKIQKGAGNLLTTEELNGIKKQLDVGGAAYSAAKLTTARTIDGVAFDGSKAISHLGLCSTAADQAAKSATVTGFQLVEGARVNIFFPAGSTAQQPTLNINNTGAKNISFPPSMKSDIPAYGMMEFVYYSNSYMPISSGQLKTSIEADNIAALEWLAKSHVVSTFDNIVTVNTDDIRGNANAVSFINDILSCNNLGTFRIRANANSKPAYDDNAVNLRLDIFNEEALPVQWGSIALTNSMFNALADSYCDLELCCRQNGASYRLTNVERINVGGVIYYSDGSTFDENLIEKLQTPFTFSSKSPGGNSLTFNSNLSNDTDIDKLKTYIENGGIIHLSLRLGSSWESMQSGETVSIGISGMAIDTACYLTFGDRRVTGTELRRKAEQGLISVQYKEDGNFEVLYWDSIITDNNEIIYRNGDTVEFTEG